MNRLRRFLLSRRTVTGSLAALLLFFAAGFFFPQRFLTTPEEMAAWQLAHPVPAWLSKVLGFDHIYTSPLFAAVLLVFSASLAVSTFDQFLLAQRRTFAAPRQEAEATGSGQGVGTDLEAIGTALRQKGYLRTYGEETVLRFVKHPWGLWGKFLLHLGMLLVICSSLCLLLTTRRGLLHLYEAGEVYVAGSPVTSQEVGLLAGRSFTLPVSVRLASIVPEFWETDDLKQLTTTVEIGEPDGTVREQRLTINQGFRYAGMKVYQSSSFGMAFFLRFTGPDGMVRKATLRIPHPTRRDQAGYRDATLPWLLPVLQAKYYADAEKERMLGEDPLLVLRLSHGPESSELALRPGESGVLGEHTVLLQRVEKWGGVIFVRSFGMGGVFCGFSLLVLGGALLYFTVPRQVVLERTGDGYRYAFRAAHFAGMYEEEFRELERALEICSNGSQRKIAQKT